MNLVKLPEPRPVYLIVGGLDKNPNTSAHLFHRKQVLLLLDGLVTAQLKNLLLCVTSRLKVDTSCILEPLSFYSISLEAISGQMKDLGYYQRARARERERMNTSARSKTRTSDLSYPLAPDPVTSVYSL